METILIYIIALAIGSYFSLVNNNRKLNRLDNETKLKLLEINIEIRKINHIAILFICTFFYTIVKLDLFDIYIPLMLSLGILFVITTIITNRKYKEHNISTEYIKGTYVYKTLFFIIISFFFFYNYYNSANGQEKVTYDYQYEARVEMSSHNYQKALTLYTKSLELDSTNGNCYYNRGCCKYFLKDTIGACEDWSKAEKNGEQHATYNLQNFCK